MLLSVGLQHSSASENQPEKEEKEENQFFIAEQIHEEACCQKSIHRRIASAQQPTDFFVDPHIFTASGKAVCNSTEKNKQEEEQSEKAEGSEQVGIEIFFR